MNEKILTLDEIHKLLTDMLDGIVTDGDLFYGSDVGARYCHLQDRGEKYLVDTMNILLGHLYMSKKYELERVAKDLVIKGLNS